MCKKEISFVTVVFFDDVIKKVVECAREVVGIGGEILLRGVILILIYLVLFVNCDRITGGRGDSIRETILKINFFETLI